jgi:hypothetical protein
VLIDLLLAKSTGLPPSRPQPIANRSVFLHCQRIAPAAIVARQAVLDPDRNVSVIQPQAVRNLPLDRKLYLSCLWPGLPELWWRGRISALPTALAFAAAANFLLVAKFVYPELLSSGLVRMAGWVGVAIWLFCVVRSVREMPLLLNPRRASGQPDRFAEAHQAYLRGQWAEAESLLSDCLAIENRDPPALILLCGVYRHTARLEAAERLLEEIRLTEAADGWWLEVAAEQNRLERDKKFSISAGRPQPESRFDAALPPAAAVPVDPPRIVSSPPTEPAASPTASPDDLAAEVSESADLYRVDAVSEISAEIDRQSDRSRLTTRAA